LSDWEPGCNFGLEKASRVVGKSFSKPPAKKGTGMTTVKTCLEQKPQPAVIFSVGPDDTILTVLQLMRDKRIRAVLVIEA